MKSDNDASRGLPEIIERHEAVAEEVCPTHCELYIDGQWTSAESDEQFETVNPTTGSVIKSVPRGQEADIDNAVSAAARAFDEIWSGTSAAQRQRVLNDIAEIIEVNEEPLAQLETLDNGKPLSEARADVSDAADHFRYFAGATRTHQGVATNEPSQAGRVVHEPYGVVGQIIPWNFPLLMASWKVAPALAAGNCTVLKPAEQTPLSVLKLAELITEIVPDGVINIVTGYGEEAGEPLVKHPNVRKIAFTGSAAAGQAVMQNAAANITDITLELGGKSPIVVFPDADIDEAVDTVIDAIFYNTGECCEAGSRLFVHDDVAEPFFDRLVNATESLTLGDPLDATTDIGPKISNEQTEETVRYLEQARKAGATFLTGGGRPTEDTFSTGCFVSPTVITDIDHGHEAVQEEIFGPVLEAVRWTDYDQMIEKVNDVKYGLAGGVLTADIDKANRAARDIEAGYIWINTYHVMPAGLPFGGYKQSGIGREVGLETLEHYSQTKTINLSL